MFAPDSSLEDAVLLSRFDRDHLLNSCSRTLFLEDQEWKSAEHYVYSRIAGNTRLSEQVAEAETAEIANKLVKPWYRMKVKNWKDLRRLYMTRALYTQVQMYEDVRNFLLSTGDKKIAEKSLYDHYWGIGRDIRGENMFGKVWMDIRKKLREDMIEAEQDN